MKEESALKTLPVVIENHGDVWGRKDGSSWYMFYCPTCKRTLSERGDCPFCNQSIDWEIKKNNG